MFMIPICSHSHVHFHSREIPIENGKQVDVYTVSQKTRHPIVAIISSNLYGYFKFFLLLESLPNLLQNNVQHFLPRTFWNDLERPSNNCTVFVC